MRNFFENKKITVMGLGLLGRGVGDVRFLAENGAELIVTDLKSEKDLLPSLTQLKGYKNITYKLGGHQLEDFENRDFILKAAGVPLDSIYIAHARKNKISIEMSSALFSRLTPATIVGVTGTRGKSTVTHLLYEVLKKGLSQTDESIFIGGNVKGISTLEMLPKTRKGDIAVLELDSWQLQGFGESRISPHISLFTTLLPDHLNYYGGNEKKYLDDKANIFRFHNEEDVLVIGSFISQRISSEYENEIKGKVIVADPKNLPEDWVVGIPGEHNRYNASLVYEAAQALGIDDAVIKQVLENFKGLPGRLEKKVSILGVSIYNDTNSTTPDATVAGLKALAQGKNVVLIMGGADKNLDMSKLVDALPVYCKNVILIPGTGTKKFLEKNVVKFVGVYEASTLEEAVEYGLEQAIKGDVLLFSPGFSSFGMFINEYDRGEKFDEIIKKAATL